MDVILKVLRESLPEAIGGLIALAIANAIGWLWAKRSHPLEELPSEPTTELQPWVEQPVRKSIWLLFVLGIFVVYISFKLVGMVAGWGSLLVLLSVFVALSPPKYHRILIMLCLVLINALFASTKIYSILVTSEVIVESIESNYFLKLLLEGPIDKALCATIFGLALGGVLVIIPLIILGLIGSEAILALFEVRGISRWDALRYQCSLLLGIQHLWQVVEDGKVTVTKPKGVFSEIGGPGVVVVRPGNAVVFEWGGEVTKIEGPGIHKTKRFERIKQVVDLRPQWSTVEVENVLTKDRVPLMLEVGVGYQIEPKEDTDRRIEKAKSEGKEFEWKFEKGEEVIEGVYPVYKDSVFKAVYLVSGVGWQRIVQGITDSFLRDVVVAYTLDQLYEPSEVARGELKESPRIIAEIGGKVKENLEETAIKFGVKIGAFDITSVEMPEDVREQVLEWWRAEWEKRVAIVKAEAEAEVLKLIELAKAKARREGADQNTSG